MQPASGSSTRSILWFDSLVGPRVPGEVGNVFHKDWEKTAVLPVTLCDLVVLVGSVRYSGAYCR
jgi:hypothetical protein